jgi:hypothetical protein
MADLREHCRVRGQRVSDERSGDDLLQQPRMIARNATMTNHVRAGRA